MDDFAVCTRSSSGSSGNEKISWFASVLPEVDDADADADDGSPLSEEIGKSTLVTTGLESHFALTSFNRVLQYTSSSTSTR
eukprot:CAMPEP_0201241382 /NCGR_PEP_ID=MMETSP0852-20130820/33599_1 /ASSEMBLY_ACC=CAM_ASM_000632 /TAXON_ID=183588 /ORGANISM="Pseudo-nitzschia fraudulenta, Strain WWA7" /LENGTH=80 /DNA_ID=CAMNT_0047537595 /DNA_START=324 /DNA_END=566 /DNA_ORIENTATION=+